MSRIISTIGTLLALALGLLFASLLHAHPYKTDSYGCHNNSKLNVYECHTGPLAGKSYPNPGGQAAMLKELTATPPTVVIHQGYLGAIVTWESIDKAATYYVAFYAWDKRDGELTQTEIDRISHIVETPITSVFLGCLLQDMDYYIRVRSVDANHQVGPWSETLHYRR